jgi:FtsH-binding integral membrane protein
VPETLALARESSFYALLFRVDENMQFQNPYSIDGMSSAAFAVESERTAFIRRTYLHLAGAVFAFIALEALLLNLISPQVIANVLGPAGNWAPLVMLVAFMAVSWVARSWAESGSSPSWQYAGLSLYVVAEALIFVPIMHIAISMTNSPAIPIQAGLITAIVFAALTAFVFLTKADLSSWGSYLGMAGLGLLAVAIAGMVFGFSLGLFFSGAMIVLLCGYIMYDTSNVLHRFQTNQHVAASLALFASVATLMWYVMRLLMSMRND